VPSGAALQEGLRCTPPRWLVTEVLVEQLAQYVPLIRVAAPHVDLRDHLCRLHFDEPWEAVGSWSPRRGVHGPVCLYVRPRSGIPSTGGTVISQTPGARSRILSTWTPTLALDESLGGPGAAAQNSCWRDARVAESDGLENRCGCTPTVGSNPTPSAHPEARPGS
jgi:hypothetical protein